MVNVTNVYKAYSIFRQKKKLPANQNSLRLFKKFLNINEKENILIVAEAREKCSMLAGPHGEVMFKILEIKNEES